MNNSFRAYGRMAILKVEDKQENAQATILILIHNRSKSLERSLIEY